MPKVYGTLVAARPREIETRRAKTQAYQIAYVPEGDPHGFPAVMNVSPEVFAELDRRSGEDIELTYIMTPPYNDKFGIAARFVALAAAAS